MIMRILISTFGPSPENTFAAIRYIPHEKLILILSEEDIDTAGFRSVRKSAQNSEVEFEHVLADKYDLKDCFRKTLNLLLSLSYGSHETHDPVEISINVSGGHKTLGEAALVAAFHIGTRAFHCEKDKIIRFPVLEKRFMHDLLSKPQVSVLKEVGTMDAIDDVIRRLNRQYAEETIRTSMKRLRKIGAIRMISSENMAANELTGAGILLLETINRIDRIQDGN